MLVAVVIISVIYGVQSEAQRRARRRRRRLSLVRAEAFALGGDEQLERNALRPAEWRPRARVVEDAEPELAEAHDVLVDLRIDDDDAGRSRIEHAFALAEAWGRDALEELGATHGELPLEPLRPSTALELASAWTGRSLFALLADLAPSARPIPD